MRAWRPCRHCLNWYIFGLNKTKVTDACIATLGRFPCLRTIDIDGGSSRLQRSWFGCNNYANLSVHFWPNRTLTRLAQDGIAN